MYEKYQIDPTHISYGRRDSWLGMTRREEEGRLVPYITCLAAESKGGYDPRGMYLLPVELLKDGEPLEAELIVTPVYAMLKAGDAEARFVIQRHDIIRMEAKGCDVRILPAFKPHEIAKDRQDGSYELCMSNVRLIVCPVRGSMEMTGYFDVIASQMHDVGFVFTADESGVIDLAVHFCRSSVMRMPSYPAFEECIDGVEKEFADYMATVPELPEEFEADRVLAAYLVWSHIMEIDGDEYVYMNKGVHKAAFSWQQCYQAMNQRQNPALAWRFMNSMFRYQDDFGMLPDSINDETKCYSGTKPPIHGVAWQYLKKFANFDFVDIKDYRKYYEGLSRMANWWLSFRDTDHDFMPQFDAADESGWDDCSMYAEGTPAEAPDLAAYLILLMESLSEMAEHLGNFFEASEWKSRSERMLKILIDEFWDGEKFITKLSGSHKVVESRSVAIFLPLLLGHRLPQEILDKMEAMLSEEGRWISEYGLTGEDMTSPRWLPVGWLAGPVLAPANLLVFLGLMESGKEELAKKIALRYLRALHNSGFAMIMNPLTGEDMSEGRWKTSKINRMSWTGAAFILMGSYLK